MHDLPMFLEVDTTGSDGTLDSRYTGNLDNSSPELRWFHVPKNAASFLVVLEDSKSYEIDSKLVVHWVVYNIPSHIHHLPAGIPPQESLPNGIYQGVNSFGKLGYAGPRPPLGDPQHRYIFRLYALHPMHKLGRRMHWSAVLEAIQSRIISVAETSVRYQCPIQRAG